MNSQDKIENTDRTEAHVERRPNSLPILRSAMMKTRRRQLMVILEFAQTEMPNIAEHLGCDLPLWVRPICLMFSVLRAYMNWHLPKTRLQEDSENPVE